jgi:hypothetical protein
MSRRITRELLTAVTVGALVLLAGAVSAKGKPQPPPPEPVYDLTELSDTPSPINDSSRTPFAINDCGDALASAGIVALGSQLAMIELQGLPGTPNTGLSDLSNQDAAGVFLVVGTCYSDDSEVATFWEVDGATGDVVSGPVTLGSADECPRTSASAVNDLGEITGDVWVQVAPDVLRNASVVWQPDGSGGFCILELPPPMADGIAVYAEPVDINNLGQVVARAELWTSDVHIHYPVLWQIDELTGEYLDPIHLGTLSAGLNSYPIAMNDWGQVVGYCNVGGGAYEAWIVDPRDMDGDGAPEWFWDGNGDGANDLMMALNPGGAATQPRDVNNAGEVVGTYRKGKQSQGGTDGFIWQHGVLTLLRELVPSEYSEWYLPAYCINDQGQIGGHGYTGGKRGGGGGMPYILTPRP